MLLSFWFYLWASSWLGSPHHDFKLQSVQRSLLRLLAGSPVLRTVSCGTTTHPLPCEKNTTLSTLSCSFTSFSEYLLIHVHPALSCCHIVLIANSGSCCSGVRFSTAFHEIFYQETVSPPWHARVTFPYPMNTVTTAHFIQDAALTVLKKLTFSIQGHQGKKLSLEKKESFCNVRSVYFLRSHKTLCGCRELFENMICKASNK